MRNEIKGCKKQRSHKLAVQEETKNLDLSIFG